MSGDAREFALVTAALARAAGIPAHPVSGLLQHEGRFYLHSWTELYLGRWITVDAMLGQFPADASHLSFVAGTADPGPDLARILDRGKAAAIPLAERLGATLLCDDAAGRTEARRRGVPVARSACSCWQSGAACSRAWGP